jgi:hypothetical protein
MEGLAAPDIKARVEAILKEQYRQVKRLLDNNKEALIAIAEALILRNELTDIDVDEILTRVEAEYPFVSTNEAEHRSFGFLGTQALPEPSAGARRNGHRNGNGKTAKKSPEPIVVPPATQSPTTPPATPTAESGELNEPE